MKWIDIAGMGEIGIIKFPSNVRPITSEENLRLLLERQSIERKALENYLKSTRQVRAIAMVNRMQLLEYDHTDGKKN
jgi:hypothetical protein